MTKVCLGKKYADGSVMLTDDIYGGTIPEEAKGKLFKYKVTDFDEEEDKFTLKYLAQAIRENGYVWIGFPYNESLMHDLYVEMVKEGHEKYHNVIGHIKVKSTRLRLKIRQSYYLFNRGKG